MTDEEARVALTGLVPASDLDDPESCRERWARARWSVLAEPGDGIAGLTIQRLGAFAALRVALRDDAPPEELDLSVRDWRRACARWRPRQDDHAYAIERAKRVGVRLIVPGDAAWPERVDELGVHAPAALWVRGSADALAAPGAAIALVGARAATAYGVQVAGEIAGELAVAGVTIVSGAAVGIDAAAHRACLAVDGSTIAVLAGGVDKAYPSGHAGLLTNVSRRGAVMSEVPCGTAPTKWRFLQQIC